MSSLKGVFRKNLANLITLGRIPLCFGAFFCAVVVMTRPQASAAWGFWGELLLILSALTDYFDGLVARKMKTMSRIGPVADQMMDKIVYCIIFPTLAVGIMHRDGGDGMWHPMLALGLCVTLLVRDHWVNFLRSIADRHQGDSGVKRIGKIRTLFALPLACVMFAYCFSRGTYSDLFYFNSLVLWVQEHDFKRILILLELLLFLINVVSAISYTKIYGTYLLDEICEGDELVRKKILSIFPNFLTLMNAVMGISAVVLAYHQKFHLSFVLLVFATVFDKLDGAAARKLGLIEDSKPGEARAITLGVILDDVADLISFCVAPAMIAAIYVQDHVNPWWFSLYALMGLARLIYFTIDRSPIPGYFKGLPSPAAALFVGGGVHLAQVIDNQAETYATHIVLLFVAVGLLMNAYFVHYVHFGRLLSQSRKLSSFVLLVMIISVFIVKGLGAIAMILMGIYLLSPVVTWRNEVNVSKD